MGDGSEVLDYMSLVLHKQAHFMHQRGEGRIPSKKTRADVPGEGRRPFCIRRACRAHAVCVSCIGEYAVCTFAEAFPRVFGWRVTWGILAGYLHPSESSGTS